MKVPLTWIFVLVLLGGCASVPVPDLGELYTGAAMRHGPETNPVIVIPGVLGSKLVEDGTGRMLWGAFGTGSISPASAEGARLVALPMGEGELSDLRDAVTSPGALDRARFRLLGLPVDLAAYAALLGTLGAGGYVDGGYLGVDYGDTHFTCFQFPFDWRRDNIENARKLHEFVLQKKQEVERENLKRFGRSGAPVKFDIVAHSMGGMIARYMLMYGDALPDKDGKPPAITWVGAKHIENVILVATPGGGSLTSLTQLVEGFQLPALPKYDAALLGTMPALYQLLPDPKLQVVVDEKTGKPLDYLDPLTWETQGWGLVDPDADKVLEKLYPEKSVPERRELAREHLRKCLDRARSLQLALNRPHKLPPGLRLDLYAGDGVDTPSGLVALSKGGFRVNTTAAGDGTVLRSSALADQRTASEQGQRVRTPIPWSQITFLQKSHLGLTKDPTFSDNVLYTLLLAPETR